VHLDQEGAGLLKKAGEHLADEVREHGGSRCGESQHLQAMHNRRDMTVLGRPLGVVVHWVIVHRDRLKGRGMGVGQVRLGARNTSPMRSSSNVLAGTITNASGSKVGDSRHRALSALEMILDNFIVERAIALVDVAEHNAVSL
jgi:hypothetical protein